MWVVLDLGYELWFQFLYQMLKISIFVRGFVLFLCFGGLNCLFMDRSAGLVMFLV